MKFLRKKEKSHKPIFTVLSDGKTWGWESTWEALEMIEILSVCITEITKKVRNGDFDDRKSSDRE